MLGFFRSKIKKFSDFFAKARFAIGNKIRGLLSSQRDESAFENLEQLFFESDLGTQLSLSLVDEVRKAVHKNPSIDTEEIIKLLKEKILNFFPPTLSSETLSKPHVIMIVGANGSGKTTSIAKLAYYYKKMGKKPLLIAADTFRAAAIDQLETWAKKTSVEIIRSKPKADPAAVVFDGLSAAKARGYDVVIIDTAGRLHTKTDLMHELEKIQRVCGKVIPDSPQETLLVLDASIGQNALDQARIFHKYTPISSILLSKLDGSAKGGIVVAIQKELNIPVKWVGLGESLEDLAPFDPEQFINALLQK